MSVPVRGASRRRRVTIAALVSATLFCLSLGLAPHQVTAAEDDGVATEAPLLDGTTETSLEDSSAPTETTAPPSSSSMPAATSTPSTSTSTTTELDATTSTGLTATTVEPEATTSTTDPDDLGGVFVTTAPSTSTPAVSTSTSTTTETTRTPATTPTTAVPTTQTTTTQPPPSTPTTPTNPPTPTTTGDDELGPASVTVVTADAGGGGTVDRGATGNRPAPSTPRSTPTTATTTPQPSNGLIDPASASAPTTSTTAVTTATTRAAGGISGGDNATTITPTSSGIGGGITSGSTTTSSVAANALVPTSSTTAAPATVDAGPVTRQTTSTTGVRITEATISQGRTPTITGFDVVPVADGTDSDDAAITVQLPWDSSQRIGVQLHPTRLLSAWTLWLTLVLLILAFWLPSPSRLVARARARGEHR